MSEKIKLIFLGTGNSVPSALRNHPGFLLNYKGENLLVDCGEGTQRQLRKANLNPCKLTRILITHWHADHVLGIPGLLKTLAMSGYSKTLFIYGPRGTRTLMNSLLKLFGFREEYKIEIEEVKGKFFENSDFFLEAEQMSHGIPCNAYSFSEKEKIRIDKNKLKKHKISEGVHLKNLKDGKDFVYKGKKYPARNFIYREKGRKISFVLDTFFNDKIIPFVKNSDVLVCGSTFTSEMKEKAEEHKHLTLDDASQIAKKTKAEKLFLVHVSQRFSNDLKKILEESKKTFKNSYLPKDLDVVEI